MQENLVIVESPAKAKKWTLINNYGDKTLIRNNVAYEVSRRVGMPFTPWCRCVDVILNGEYRGNYQLTDQLTVDAHRVNIEEMMPEDCEGEALTGGYLVELDPILWKKDRRSLKLLEEQKTEQIK